VTPAVTEPEMIPVRPTPCAACQTESTSEPSTLPSEPMVNRACPPLVWSCAVKLPDQRPIVETLSPAIGPGCVGGELHAPNVKVVAIKKES